MSNQVNESTKAKGLENVGATCYMNSVLQCFYHVQVLTNELLNCKCNSKSSMTYAYKDTIIQLSSKKVKTAKPILFKNVISQNPLFRGIQANDSKDLVLYFLETIEDELTALNFLCKNPKYINPIKLIKDVQDPELKKTMTFFQNNNKSIISDLFYGFKSQIVECNNCHDKSLNYQIFNLIIFPIETIYISKEDNKETTNKTRPNKVDKDDYDYGKNNMHPTTGHTYGVDSIEKQNRINNRGKNGKRRTVTLYDCLDNETNNMFFNGDNQLFCNKCQQLSDATAKNKIYSSPHVLILILNRGKANQFDCDVDFEDKINLEKYVENKDSPLDYNLIGVISHLGESNMSGHFIADCKHFDGSWYSFSDRSVSGPYREYQRHKEVTPYILFYQSNKI